MSAATLREAAALMRERAEAAGPGPWEIHEEHGADFTGEGWSNLSVDGSDGKSVAWYCDEQEGIDSAPHIASWHPPVALAVADWLESVAGSCVPPPPESALDVVDAGRTICEKDYEHALAVAAAYLGTDA